MSIREKNTWLYFMTQKKKKINLQGIFHCMTLKRYNVLLQLNKEQTPHVLSI